ncbi:MAG: cysteine desulfurase [Gammaproteobacteria bacterium]|nr:cysteine desulfurase [Gammaproteobacteria bacterium]
MNIAVNPLDSEVKAESTGFDVEKIRADFPILNQQIHGKPLVYLDSGASAQKPNAVIAAVDHYYRTSHANVHRGVHTLSERATDIYEGARAKVCSFINALSTEEIVFVRGTTEAINLVAQSYGRANVRAGDEILITYMEHHSNIVPWQMLCEQTGAVLKVVPINDDGELELEQYGKLLGPRTRIVAITHVSNALGTINPVRDMVVQAHAVGAVVVVDGAQAVPHLAVDMQRLDCDFYAFSAHKVFGPTGIGVLYGKAKLLDVMPPYQGGGEMIREVTFENTVYNDLPHKFEAGTPHIAGAAGLGAALEYVDQIGLHNIEVYERDLLEYGTGLAQQVEGLRLIGTARHKASILTFVLDDIHAHDVGTILDHQGIAIRTGHHCAMPVMKRYGVAATARASLALYNTREDLDVLFHGIEEVKKVFA